MKNTPTMMAFLVLLATVFSATVLEAPQAIAAPDSASGYVCVAKLQCPNTVDSGLQELPVDEDTLIRSGTRDEARSACLKTYPNAYKSLQKRAPAGCQIRSDALSARGEG